jgi:RimJ/RimL family protein N-acetyltransferase
MELVECTSNYWESVRSLRTNTHNQQFFHTQAKITPNQQVKFMKKNSHRYRICLINKAVVGYIGILGDDEITYCVHPDHQGKGIGTFMVSEFTKLNNTLTAYVLPENIGSSRVFEKLGFNKQIYYKWVKKENEK